MSVSCFSSRVAQELPLVSGNARITTGWRKGGSIIMKWVKALKRKITALKSAQTDDAGRWETAAMVYGGDIYAVLVRDRALRHLTRVDNRWADHRHDAERPFIR